MLKTQLRSYLVLTALALCAVVAFWGMYQMYLQAHSPIGWGLLRGPVVLLVIGIAIIEPISKLANISKLSAGVVAVSAIAVFTGTVWPLLVTLWLALACYVVGRAVFSALRLDTTGQTFISILLTGAGVYGTAVGLAAHFPVNYPGIYGFALAVPVVLGRRQIYEVLDSLRIVCVPSIEHRWLDLAIVTVALVHFTVALMPEVGSDALAMHLFIPGHLVQRHEWGFDATTYVWAVMPMIGDWLYSIGYMLAGETAARMINVGFIFILSWLLRDLVIWAGGHARGARWAVLLFLSTPLTFTESSSLFIESVWAAFLVAGSLSIVKVLYSRDEPKAHLPVAGILLGVALAAKAITFMVFPALLLMLILGYRSWFRLNLVRILILSLVLFIAMGGAPYFTAWYLTGNPVFPFYNQLFQSPLWPAVNFEATAFGKGLSWDILYQVVFHSGKYLESNAGAAGFQWLLLFAPALLALLFTRQYKGLTLFIVAVIFVALVFQSTAYLRYIFPAYLWVSAGIGVALSASREGSLLLTKALYAVVALTVALNLAFLKSGTYYGDISLQPLLSSSGRDAYLNSRAPVRKAVKLVNQVNIGRTPVAVLSAPLMAELNSDALYANWYNMGFQREISSVRTEQDIVNVLLKRGVNFIILDSNWKGVNCCSDGALKQVLVEEVSEKIAEYGSISVRKIKKEYLFKTELLSDVDFTTINSWNLVPGARYSAATGTLLVSVISPVTQSVTVTPGGQYLDTVVARCAKEPSSGRVQVNWHDASGQFISADIKTFDCTAAWSEHTMQVFAPDNAASAVVYAAGHGQSMIEFKSVSFRQ
jgi:hypothetical protein